VICVHAIIFSGVAIRGEIAASSVTGSGDIPAGTVAKGHVPALPAIPCAEQVGFGGLINRYLYVYDIQRQ